MSADDQVVRGPGVVILALVFLGGKISGILSDIGVNI